METPIENIYQYIGERIFLLRKVKNMTQDDLAALAGVSRIQIINIEAGNSGPSIKTLFNMINALGCTYNDIMPTVEQLKSYTPNVDRKALKAARLEKRIADMQRVLKKYKR